MAMLTRASSEKRLMRPRSRSFMRGWVTPQRRAASACVQPLAVTRAESARASSARARRLAASCGVSANASKTLVKVWVCSVMIGASSVRGSAASRSATGRLERVVRTQAE